MTLNAIFINSSLQSNPRYQLSLKSENIKILPILLAAIFFCQNILPTLFNIYTTYNDGMVNREVVCHPFMAKTTVMHANSLPPLWYG
jgi:hypothetical protein